MRKYIKEEINKIADELCNKNNLIRTEDCMDVYKRFKTMTKEGYFVYPSVRSLRQGKQPLKYSKSNPDTIYNINLWIHLNNQKFELMSDEYKSEEVELKWLCKNNKCKKYNKEFLKCWHTVRQGHSCSDCGINKMKDKNKTPQKGKSLLDIYPELCNNYWDYKRNNNNPKQYCSKSNQSVYWKCDDCGYSLPNKLSINNIVAHGLSCPKCSDKISYPEKFMFNLLEQLNINFKTQKMFEWSKNMTSGKKVYDFWIEDNNCIIETHGGQHYEINTINWGKLDKIQENDSIKCLLALDNGIRSEDYIVVDCRESSVKWIKYSIMNSNLPKLFNFKEEDINWDECNEKATKNKVKEVCDLWSNGIESITEIGKLVKLSRSVIINHLKKGNEIGWCNYNSIEVMKKNGILLGKNNGKPIVQVNERGEFIKRFESMSEASRLLKLQVGGISRVCNKKAKSTCGFIFIFEEEI